MVRSVLFFLISRLWVARHVIEILVLLKPDDDITLYITEAMLTPIYA